MTYEPPQNQPIRVSLEDLETQAVRDRAATMANATGGLTRAVGTPQPAASSARFGKSVLALGGLGIAGGVIGGLLSELIANPDGERFTNPTMSASVWTAAAAVGIALALLSWSGINAKSGARVGRDLLYGLPIAAVGGAIAGAIAQQIYYPMVRSAVKKAIRNADTPEEAFKMVQNALHLPRGIAFAMCGLGIGVAMGFAARSFRRGQNAAIGGVVGGFIGGFLFDYLGEWINADSGWGPRMAAFVIMGGLIGIGIGLVDELRKDLWLEIVSGGMAGKQFIIWESRCRVGAAPSADVTLIKDPAIAPEHFALVRSGSTISVEVLPGASPLLVNGNQTERAVVADGSMIQVGQTTLRIGQQNAKMPSIGKL